MTGECYSGTAMANRLCEICGNEVGQEIGRCPFCGQISEHPSILPTRASMPAGRVHRTLNLERGLPLVQEALDRLDAAIDAARQEGLRGLTLIHGYGSSGTGGAIKVAVRERLHFLQARGLVDTVIAGEELENRSGRGRHLVRRFPFLAGHPHLNRHNPGITVLLLTNR